MSLYNKSCCYGQRNPSKVDPFSCMACGRGGIGRHVRLRGVCDEHTGSSPVGRTKISTDRNVSAFRFSPFI